jgi:hypothetical protein
MPSLNIDWSVFNKAPESTCTCRCGTSYRSHVKVIKIDGSFVTISRKSCPNCGKNEGNVYSVQMDPENWTIK